MALRDPQARLTTFSRCGVLCLAGGGRTCVAHTLPETPDTFFYQLLTGGGTVSILSAYVESWDATSIVFVNSISVAQRGYLHAQVIHSINR